MTVLSVVVGVAKPLSMLITAEGLSEALEANPVTTTSPRAGETLPGWNGILAKGLPPFELSNTAAFVRVFEKAKRMALYPMPTVKAWDDPTVGP